MTNNEARTMLNGYVDKIITLNKASTKLQTNLQINAKFEIGEIVKFGFIQGKYMEWIVIGKKDGIAQLLAKDIVGKNTYNDEKKSVTWENSSIYRWLNNSFFNLFSDQEKEKIVKSNSNNTNSTEYIHLLRIEEAVNISTNFLKCSEWWWLSSPGHYQDCKTDVTSYGRIDAIGRRVDSIGGVRPVIYIYI